MPVPTAVPPCASRSSLGSTDRRRALPFSTWLRQPDSSCASVTGIASMRWVRPVLTIAPDCASRAASAAASCSSAGSSSSRSSNAALTWMAVGITSLLLWPMLT